MMDFHEKALELSDVNRHMSVTEIYHALREAYREGLERAAVIAWERPLDFVDAECQQNVIDALRGSG